MAVAGAVDVMEQDPATDSESESLDAGGSNDQGLDEEVCIAVGLVEGLWR